jgi:hypothetical protein
MDIKAAFTGGQNFYLWTKPAKDQTVFPGRLDEIRRPALHIRQVPAEEAFIRLTQA